MDKIDVTKERALELAYSFVGEHWESLNEDDITVSTLRYLFTQNCDNHGTYLKLYTQRRLQRAIVYCRRYFEDIS